MISCIIVEDEVRCVNVLQTMIKSNDWININVIAVVDTIVDAVSEINAQKPELVFLDIELKDGSSFDIFDKLIYKDFQVIFTTAFDNYALKAFKHSALDYLLKPVDNEEFKEALHKFSKHTHSLSFEDKIENASQMYHSKSDWKNQRIAIRKNDDIFFERLEDIIAFKAISGYTEIYTNDGKMHLTTKNLSFYEDLVTEMSRFFRIHHSAIINFDFISSLNFPKNSRNAYVTMKDNSTFEVSSRKLPQIKEILDL